MRPPGAGVGGAFDHVEVAVLRRLADDVDDAAGGAAAEQERRRPLVDLDAIEREGIAGVPARIANAVAIEIVARGVAADGDVVALHAAFARGEGDARHVAQRFLHRGRALVLHQLLRHHVDGLRRVEERRGNAGQARRGRLIAAAGLAFDVHRRQFDRCLLRIGAAGENQRGDAGGEAERGAGLPAQAGEGDGTRAAGGRLSGVSVIGGTSSLE